jgi:transcriptional regulator with XRE-family HTH domain
VPIHSPAYQRFVARLRTARKEARLTQVQVARKLKRPQSYIAKSESGERRVDAVELKRFALIYGKSMEYFVDED